MEEDKDGKKRNGGGGKGNRKGAPQGEVISPLLSNLYLHILDRIWERHPLERKLGARIVRYADDIVVLCREGTEHPMQMLRRILERLELTLNETKTRIVKAFDDEFKFLCRTYENVWDALGRRMGRP
jgi:retron-type reverse transcriptase